ncbi:MAG: hypothetical protein DA408_18750 [Bacteroidetes bacterium]|nr:MAG: hypothetical protein C7N36_07245 [Bacteroidota bacterium]PTM09255.1 MAG: hypothetical protein DA408_18750 [Bacteroidota bacterium]
MHKHLVLILLSILALNFSATAQRNTKCKVAFDEIDPFDSLHTVGSNVVALGYMIPSLYETAKGPKFIEEAEAFLLYSEQDSISGFFLNLVLPEYKLQPIRAGMNVKMLLEDSTVIGLYNFPDEGQFDRNINMRVYQHTCALPLDYYYKLAFLKIDQIRVEYDQQFRTIILSPQQQEALRAAIECVGEHVALYPIKP